MSKVKIYDIIFNWVSDPYREPSLTQVTVGADPFEVWGDDMDDWTPSQIEWDRSIWQFFERMDELTSYYSNDNKGEWYIVDYVFNKELDLSDIK